MWKDFKPTILFLVKFFAIYGILSVVYGKYISYYDSLEKPKTDPITSFVAFSCTNSSTVFGYRPIIIRNDHLNSKSEAEQTYDSIWLSGKYAISVEEGCNGINIMILFIAFIIAFGGKLLNTLLFIPFGLLFIHASNIGRLMLLALINVKFEGQTFHFFHKFGFTAIIYLAILFLWFLWVSKFSGKKKMTKR
tara:strand:+ start:788 stop:1363 length:576 start_codon:yes stop_codon:yes gene_type:complete